MEFQVRKAESGHRQATWLELFFDLAFVISIATLSHQVVDHPSPYTLLRYVLLLIPVWWVWNQFTWYASHFDNDDLIFRFLMLSGVGGTLVLAAGLSSLEHGHPTQFVAAYLFLHVVLGFGWLRALRKISSLRPYISLKLAGIALGLVAFTASLFLHDVAQQVCWATGIFLQLLLPVFAWSTVKQTISVHPHHLTERHGLFTIIVLGESLLALTHSLGHGMTVESGLLDLTLFLYPLALWWVYFDWHYDPLKLNRVAQAFGFNYGHYFIYGSLGLVAAGIGIFGKDQRLGLMTLLIGAAVFLLALSLMNLIRTSFQWRVGVRLATACLLCLYSLCVTPSNPPWILGIGAITLVALAITENRLSHRKDTTSDPEPPKPSL